MENWIVSEKKNKEMALRVNVWENEIGNTTKLTVPCKIGSTVYCIIARGVMGTVFTNGGVVPRKVNKIIWDGKNIEIYSERIGYGSTENNCNYYGILGDLVFTEKEQAEARLAELRGE